MSTEAITINLADSRSAYIQRLLVEPDTTISSLLEDKEISTDGINLTINGDAVASTYKLQDGDTVTITPRKVSGA